MIIILNTLMKQKIKYFKKILLVFLEIFMYKVFKIEKVKKRDNI